MRLTHPRHTPLLKELSLMNNPITEQRNYNGLVTRKLSELRVLDHCKLPEGEKRATKENIITVQMVLESSFTRKRAETLDYASVSWKIGNQKENLDIENCWRSIVELDLCHQGVRTIQVNL